MADHLLIKEPYPNTSNDFDLLLPSSCPAAFTVGFADVGAAGGAAGGVAVAGVVAGVAAFVEADDDAAAAMLDGVDAGAHSLVTTQSVHASVIAN